MSIDRENVHLAQRRTKQNQNNKKRRWPLVVAGLSFMSASMGAAFAIFMTSKPLQQSALSAEEKAIFGDENLTASALGVPKLTRPVNILVMGTIVLTSDLPGATDQNPGEYLAQVNSTLDGHSDAMLLVRFDPATNKITALSIPRDSRVYIEEVGYSKINAANYVGGAALAAQTVSDMLGDVTIDRYIRVNVGGFSQLIDALGGVEVYVPKRMKYQDDSQHLYINLNEGMQHLDGDKAVQYMRFRHDDLGDIGRIQRQQTLLRAIFEQKLNLETVSRIPEIVKVLKRNIDTNLSMQELLALAAFGAQTDLESAKMLMVPGRFSAPEEFPLSYWIVDEYSLPRLVSEHFDLPLQYAESYGSIEATTPQYIRVAIQDSIAEPDATDLATDLLYESGYDRVFRAEYDWHQPLEKTQIVAQQGDTTMAEQVRRDLGIGEVVVESTGSLESDVTVRIGRDWLELRRKSLSASQDELELESDDFDHSEGTIESDFNPVGYRS
ncbi:transcriptional attenuator, LytR family [Thalassoporum mexicanum PCC 7367]|uniref:LCP family protein n=1 Tax=Thalassoporum mexicanum TaxID=3457544 RepID=UPI00029F9B9E|nr:LCP family protein [Pseudanabaena sp. PCC 7367]AFY70589.1 transcriptional attenuator, LytR family [Pseudanabaena sp. PCC 7367]